MIDRSRRRLAIAGLLLAAGRSERFGGPKLVAPVTNAAGVATAVAVAAYRNLSAILPRTVVVVRPHAHALEALLRAEGAQIVVCARADEGMGASLACGVAATADAQGWLIALADMPWIASRTIEEVTRTLAAGAGIAMPVHGGRRGHPVGFARRHRDALLALAGDEGARSIVAAHPAEVVALAVDDPGVLRDVDVPADLS